MARRVREYNVKSRLAVSGEQANQAIHDWTAQYATERRITRLRKDYQRKERALTNVSQQAVGHAKAAERFGQSLTDVNASVQRQNTDVQKLEARYKAAQERLLKQMQSDPMSYLKPKQQANWAAMSKKEQAQVWQNVVNRESQRLAEYQTYMAAYKQATAAGRAAEAQRQQALRLNARVERANKRILQAQRAYMRAYRKYKDSRFVPWTP